MIDYGFWLSGKLDSPEIEMISYKEYMQRLQGEPVEKEIKRWEDIYHYGFGYTRCPYCGDETEWYNPISQRFQSDLKNNQRTHCPKCGKRVYAREGWLMNQPD